MTLLRDRALSASAAVRRRWLDLVAGESGASAVEYGLIVSLIAVALIVGATALGSAIGNGLFQGLADYFSGLL